MDQRKLSELSVFFPLYNEEKNIEKLVEESLKTFPKVSKKFEVILVNDGSTDNTKKICDDLAKKHKEVKVINQSNRGYGGALKAGFKNSKYKYVFYSDGDLQFRLKEIKKFLRHIKKYDFVIGYRRRRAEGIKRAAISFLLKIWNKIFFNFPFYIKDVDCAFKLIRKDSLKKVLTLVSDGGMISTEMLLKAHKKGLKIKQIPVNHYKRKHGTPTGDSTRVIKRALIETKKLLAVFPKELEEIKLKLVAFGIFLILFPLSFQITFMQNDDYTHYRLIQGFLSGNFRLDPYIGATFYLQGILGSLFSLIFSSRYLPILTLSVSILSFYVFARILKDHLELKFKDALLVSFLLLLNPLFLYSIWGFMTENFFLLFFLISIYFIYNFKRSDLNKDYYLANLFIILSYFVRQFAFVTSIAFAIYLLINKKFKKGLLQLGLFLTLLLFHYKIFPITPQMYDGKINFSSLLNFERSFSLLIVIGIYLGLFAFPLIVKNFVDISFFKSKLKVLSLLLIIPLSIFLQNSFEPKKIDFTARLKSGKVVPQFAKVEFPYLENVFGRKGFLEDNLEGNKYHYPGFFDLFAILDFVGKIGLVLLILLLFYNYRHIFKFSFIYVGGFILLLLVAPRVFDRYLLNIIPLFMVFLVSLNTKFSNLQRFLTIGFLGLFLILGYQYSLDHIFVNKYAWEKAEQIYVEEGVPKYQINVNHSWRSLYETDKNQLYYLEYDESKRRNSDLFEVVETHVVDFPLNFYLKPKITLFKRLAEFDN